MIDSSSSSPPTRIDWLTTMPPRLMTATSDVPPPTSTIIDPVGSPTGSPAPMAAAVLVHLLDEVAQHLLGHLEVGDDAVLQRPNRLNRPGRAAEHPLGLD